MQLMSMQCPACGGAIDSNITSRIVTCEYCGSKFVLDGEQAAEFVESMAGAQGQNEYAEDYDTSSLDIVDFAAEACEEFLDEFDNGSSFDCTKKIIRGLEIGDDEEIYLIHDDTMLGSGKNGFAITNCGLYCRDLGEQPNFYDWEEFAGFDMPEADDNYIACGRHHVCYFTDDSDINPELLELYRKLHRHLTR